MLSQYHLKKNIIYLKKYIKNICSFFKTISYIHIYIYTLTLNKPLKYTRRKYIYLKRIKKNIIVKLHFTFIAIYIKKSGINNLYIY